MYKTLLIAAPILALAMLPVRAGAQTDAAATGRQAAANQIGLMEYCHDKGFVGADAVATQRGLYDALPAAPAGSPSTDDAEALGRTGTLSANGTQYTLSSMAEKQNSSVGAVCTQMADNAKRIASMKASMPAMPAMPGGMPSMPSMPGMPAAPK